MKTILQGLVNIQNKGSDILSPETGAAQSDAHYFFRYETLALSNGLGT
jgi:hypothetical protein